MNNELFKTKNKYINKSITPVKRNWYKITMVFTLLFSRMTMDTSLVSFTAATACPPALTNRRSLAPSPPMVCWPWLAQKSPGEAILAAATAASLSLVTKSPMLLLHLLRGQGGGGQTGALRGSSPLQPATIHWAVGWGLWSLYTPLLDFFTLWSFHCSLFPFSFLDHS